MSDILEKKWKQTLTFIVEELDNLQFKKLLELLSKIPKRLKTAKNRENLPQIIIEHYGLEDSVFAIADAMEKIPRRDNKIQDPLKTFLERLKAKKEKNTGKKRKCDPNTTEQTEAGGSRPVMKKQILAGQPATRKSISDLRAAHEVVDTDTIWGRIMHKSRLQTYKTQKKDYFYLVVADETASINVMVYGKSRYQKLQKGKHYLFRKLIRDNDLFKVTSQTIVAELCAFDIPKEVEEKAKRVSSHSPFVSIKEVKERDSGKVSVEGIITEVCPSELIKVDDAKRKTKKQQFRIKDNTGSIEVVIWGSNVKQCKNLAVDDVVKLTDVKINKYFDSVTLQSTSITNIEQVDKVIIRNYKLKIVAVAQCYKRQTRLEVILDQKPGTHTMVVKTDLLAEAYSLSLGKKFKSHLVEALPLMGEAQIEGNEIKAIQNIEARI